MNLKHHLFISEMLKHGNTEQAYKAVYPRAEGKAAVSAANRLLARPEVAEVIEEATKRIRAEAEQELRKRIEADLFSQLEMKQRLTRIARGDYETEKTYKKHGGYEVVSVKPSISNMLRAMDMFSRLEGWYIKHKPETKETKPEKKPWVPLPPEQRWPATRKVYGPSRFDIYEDDTDYKWQWWDPDDSNTVEQFAAYLASRARRKGIGSIPEREIKKLPIDWQTCHKINAGKWDMKYYELMELPKEPRQGAGQAEDSNEPPATETEEESEVSRKLKELYERVQAERAANTSDTKINTSSFRGGREEVDEKPIQKLLELQHERYMRKQTIENWKTYLDLSKLYNARKLPPEKRKTLELQAGWEFLPGNETIVRKVA